MTSDLIDEHDSAWAALFQDLGDRLDAVDVYGPLVEAGGFVWRRDNEDRSKRSFREVPGGR